MSFYIRISHSPVCARRAIIWDIARFEVTFRVTVSLRVKVKTRSRACVRVTARSMGWVRV